MSHTWLLAAAALLAAGCGQQRQEPAAGADAPAASAAQTSVGPSKQPQLLPVRKPAPELQFATEHGEPVTLARFAGRVVVLNLWATWCAPCVREMPSLDRLAQQLPELAVVPVSMDVPGPQPAVEFLRRRGLTHLQVYHDPDGQLMRRLGAFGLPATAVIDRQGRIAALFQGEVDWTSERVIELLKGV